MMKWIITAAAVPLCGAAIVLAVGAALPRDHVASAEAAIAAPAGTVAALVRDVAAQPRWRGSVTEVEIVERRAKGLRYIERSGSDAIPFDFVEEEEGRLFRSTIADPGLPFGGSWTIRLVPEGASTRVTIEERGTVRNPVYRFFSALVFGHHATMRAYLADLGKAASGGPS